MRRRHHPNKAKSHWVYDLKATRSLYGVSRNTPLNWIKQGLRPIDDQKPVAFRGDELNRFHLQRRGKLRCRLEPHEFFCVGCKRPKQPFDGEIEVIPSRKGAARITGVWPDCRGAVFRFVGPRGTPAFFERYAVKSRDEK
jgi:hypothetical protein